MSFKLILATIFLTVQAGAEEATTMDTDADIPPEVMAYISGANAPEAIAFDFLIGSWEVDGIRLMPDGSRLNYKANWEAHYINDKRMVVDDFQVISPKGEVISSYVTLRTYSPISKRWELSGLGAMVPALETHEWYGKSENDDMVLTATGRTPDGRMIVNRIRFYEIASETFKWQSEISFDRGENWIEAGTLSARRLPN